MDADSRNTTRIEIVIPSRSVLTSILDRLSRVPGVTLNLLRGRVTQEDAWFKLEVGGRRRHVSNLIRLGRRLGARIQSLQEGAACVR